MIELQNVSYSYGGDALLSDVSLHLAPGSFHFLTGPSGAGKTTLLKLCYLELQPTRGQVVAFGKPAERINRDGVAMLRRRVGVVHQECAFLDHLPIRENVALPMTVSGLDPNQHNGEIDDLLAWVGLSDRPMPRPRSCRAGNGNALPWPGR